LSDAEALLRGIVLALGEKEDADFVAALKLLGPSLVRRLFAWLDHHEPAADRAGAR
jgi:hypothetical protein